MFGLSTIEEFKWNSKNAVSTYFQIKSRYVLGENGDNHEKPQ
jgi:hypothetical protein